MMNSIHDFMHKWEESLNRDAMLARRIDHIKSTIEEGKAVIEIEIDGRGIFTMVLEEKKFRLTSGKSTTPLLRWRVPLTLFKEVLLGKEKILYALLDKVGALSFDTPHFTHWNGATALATILIAQEMVKKDHETRKILENIER
jgi:hypothetical protein